MLTASRCSAHRCIISISREGISLSITDKGPKWSSDYPARHHLQQSQAHSTSRSRHKRYWYEYNYEYAPKLLRVLYTALFIAVGVRVRVRVPWINQSINLSIFTHIRTGTGTVRYPTRDDGPSKGLFMRRWDIVRTWVFGKTGRGGCKTYRNVHIENILTYTSENWGGPGSRRLPELFSSYMLEL